MRPTDANEETLLLPLSPSSVGLLLPGLGRDASQILGPEKQRIIENLGPVVQNFFTVTLSISPQFVSYISTSKANTLLFFVEKMREYFALQ